MSSLSQRRISSRYHQKHVKEYRAYSRTFYKKNSASQKLYQKELRKKRNLLLKNFNVDKEFKTLLAGDPWLRLVTLATKKRRV